MPPHRKHYYINRHSHSSFVVKEGSNLSFSGILGIILPAPFYIAQFSRFRDVRIPRLTFACVECSHVNATQDTCNISQLRNGEYNASNVCRFVFDFEEHFCCRAMLRITPGLFLFCFSWR